MFEAIIAALSVLISFKGILFVFLGCVWGLILGALPGVGGPTGLILLLPLTFGMDPMLAMLLYVGVMGGSPFGGSISAILLNVPGTPINAATCFDGYPMARKGEAGKALGISATASCMGALFGLTILAALLPVARAIILAFTPPEFFMIVLFGLATVVITSRGNMIKGFIAGGIGILLSFVGYCGVTGDVRYSLGTEYLWDGIELVPLFIGIFAISEALHLSVGKRGTIADQGIALTKLGGAWLGFKEVFRRKWCFLRGSAIGTIIGIIPGVGGTVANFISYTVTVQLSKHPETFGRGNPEGVLASESANNAKDGGALVPTIVFGIPGSLEMAILLGAFILHGLVPGPAMLQDHLDLVWILILGLALSNIIASSLGFFLIKILVRITTVNLAYIVPVIVVLSFTGVFAMRTEVWDILVTAIFGLVGYGMRRHGFPLVPLVIGYVLGAIAEKAFHQSLMVADGSYSIFVNRPIAATLLIVTLLSLSVPFLLSKRTSKGDEHNETP